MDRTASTTIVIAVILLAFVGMYLGWRARGRRQAALPRPAAVPANPGAELLEVEAFYVATTIAGEPLNRVAVSGLGFRGRATVRLVEGGLVLSIAGEPDAFVPVADLRDADRATWTIDRVVESDGLALVAWTLGGVAVDSYLRLVDPEDTARLIEAVRALQLGTSTGTGTREGAPPGGAQAGQNQQTPIQGSGTK